MQKNKIYNLTVNLKKSKNVLAPKFIEMNMIILSF